MARPGSNHEKLNVRVRKGNTEKLKTIAAKLKCISVYEGQEIGSIGKLMDAIAGIPSEKIEAIAFLLDINCNERQG